VANTRVNIDVNINTSDAAQSLRQLQAQINSFQSALNTNNRVQASAAKNLASELSEMVNAGGLFSAETVRMQTAASRLDKTLQKGQGTIGQFFNARFKKGSNEAAAVLSLANARASALETQFIATGSAANGFRESLAIRPLQAFNSQAAVSAQKLAIHRAMLTQSTTSMINFGKNTQWAGRQLMVGFTVPLTIFAATSGKVFREIEKETINFRKVYGDAFTPPEEMEANLEAVKELAKEYTKYGIAVKDTIGLAAQAAAAGSQGADLIDATREATRLATLGQMEQSEALETTIALQTAFGLQSKDLTKTINFLNMVENQTVVTLQDLAQAIPRVAPVIKGLGGSVEDMAAMLAAMQEGGVSAAQGANALKSGLASLINPTNRAVEKLGELGININAIVDANRGDLMGTVQGFARALATLDEFGKQQALEKVFGKYQYARLGALFNNIIKDGSQASRVMDTAALSAAQLAASATKELGAIEDSSATKFVAAMERLKLAIAPIGEMFTQLAIPVLEFLGSLVEKFNSLPDFAKKFIGFGTVITGILIPAGTMFLGLLMNLTGTLIKFGNVIGVAFKGFTKGGISGSIQAVSQTLKYMSLAEMDAANAAMQLGQSTEFVNMALRDQPLAAGVASTAVDELAASYQILAARMMDASKASVAGGAFAIPGAAMTRARGGSSNLAGRPLPIVARNSGGTIPGVGNRDTVPAVLTPGEFVVNKKATQENFSLLHAINSGKPVSMLNTGGGAGMTAAMQRVMARVQTQRQEAATIPIAMGGRGGTRKTQASNAASSRSSQDLYNTLTGKYQKGQNVRVDTLRFAVERLGFSPEQLGLKTRGNLTFRMSQDSNLAMMRGDLTRDNLLKELNTPDVYSPLAKQLDSYLGAKLDRNVFDRIYKEEILKLPMTGITNGRFEKASRNAVRKYLDSAGFPKTRRNDFIRDVLQGDAVNANASLPLIKQTLDARGIQYSSGKNKKDLYVDMDGRQINIGNLAGREAGNLGRPEGVLDYAGLRGSGQATHANKGGMIPGVQYANIGMLMKNFQRLSGSSRGLLPGWLTGTGGGLQKNDRKRIMGSSSSLGRDVLDESMLSAEFLQRGHVAKGIKIDDERTYHPGLMIWQSPRVNQGLKGGPSFGKITGEDIYNDLANTPAHPFSLQLEAARRLGIPDTISIPAIERSYNDARNIFGSIGETPLKPGEFDNIFTDILKRNLPEKLYDSLRMQGTSRLKSTGKSSGRYVMSESSQLNMGGMISMLGGGGIAAAANAARGARGRIPANIVEWFSRMTTSISQSNRDDMLQNIPANIKRGLSTSRKKIDITRGSVDPISGGTLKEVSSWSTGKGVGRFIESSRLFDKMNNSKFQIAQRSQGMKRDIDWLRSLGPDGPHPLKTWSPFNQENGALGLRLTPEEIQASGGVIWKANKKKLEERIKRDQEFIAGHQKIIDDLQESNIPTIYKTSIKKGEKYFDVSGRIVPRDEQRINNPAASNEILDEKEVALLGARLTGRPKTRIVEREEAQARYDKAKEEIKKIRMAIVRGEVSRDKAKPDLDRLYDESENMAAFVNWGRGREVSYPNVVSKLNMGGILPQMRNIGGEIFDSTKTSRNIVPGVGNKDTVPAVLTPGEFVINKDATKKNLDLLRSVNNGTLMGYAEGGDIIGFGADGKPIKDPEKAKALAQKGSPIYEYQSDAVLGRNAMDDKTIGREIGRAIAIRRTTTTRQRGFSSRTLGFGKENKANSAIGRGLQSMGGMKGMGASMGIGMAGGALMMGAGSVGESNAGLGAAMNAGGMALSMGSMLPMLGPMLAPLAAIALPAAAVAAALAAVGAGLYIWRKSVDDAATKAAEFGANIGATANALNTMAQVLGTETPAQARQKAVMGISSEEEATIANEFSGVFESGAGQKFIEDLQNSTSAERFQKLSDYLKTAIASGMMDQKAATTFAKAVGLKLGDSVLSNQAVSSISGQKTGTSAIKEIADMRKAAVDADGSLAKLAVSSGEASLSNETAGRAIGAATQIIQDYGNVIGVAEQQYAEGTIGWNEYHTAITEARTAQEQYTNVIKKSVSNAAEQGAARQALDQQMVAAGYTEDQVGAITNSTNIGTSSLGFSESKDYLRPALSLLSGNLVGAALGMVDVITPSQSAYQKEFVKQQADVQFDKSFGELDSTQQTSLVEESKEAQDLAREVDLEGLNEAIKASVLAGDMTAEQAAQFGQEIMYNVDALKALRDGASIATAQFITFAQNIPGITKGQSSDVVTIGKEFEAAGGNTALIENYIASLPENLLKTGIETLKSAGIQTGDTGRNIISPEEQERRRTDIAFGLQSLSGSVGVEQAVAIQKSDAYGKAVREVDGSEKINKAFARAAEGGVVEKVIRYVIQTEGENTPAEMISSITKLTIAQEDIMSLPDEMIKGLKIDTTDPADLLKFGAAAKTLKDQWKIIENLNPNINMTAAMEFLTLDAEGKPLTPEQVSKNVIKLNKAMKDLESGNSEIRKKAMIDIAVAYSGKNIAGGTPQEAAANAIAGLREQFKNFDKLDPVVQEQMIEIRMGYEVKNLSLVMQLNSAMAALKTATDAESRQIILKRIASLQSQIGTEKALVEATVAPIPGSGSSSGSSGGGEKSIAQQLKEQAKLSGETFKGISNLQNEKGFKNFIAGPFAPEFLEYLRSQGAAGLKLIKGGLEKVKAAYADYQKTKISDAAAMAALTPQALVQESKKTALSSQYNKKLADKGLYEDDINAIRELISDEDLLYAQQLRRKLKDKGTSKEEKREINQKLQAFKEAREAAERDAPIINQAQKISGSITDMKTQTSLLVAELGFINEGKTPELAAALAAAGLKAGDATGKVELLTDAYNKLKAAEYARDPGRLEQEKRDNLMEIKDVQRQIEEIEIVKPLEDLVEAQQKIIDGQEKIVRGKQQEVDIIGRNIELKQRELEPLDDQIEKLQELSDKTSEAYDAQIEALDEIYNREENIAKLKQGQLDVAQALSRGDVAAAAQGALGMSQELARQSREEARSALESQKEKATQNIQNKILEIEKQKKKINKDIEDLQMRQRVIQDEIYIIQSTKILPAENKIYDLQIQINNEADRLATKYNNAAEALENLRVKLKDLQKDQDRLNKTIPGDNAGETEATPAEPAPDPYPIGQSGMLLNPAGPALTTGGGYLGGSGGGGSNSVNIPPVKTLTPSAPSAPTPTADQSQRLADAARLAAAARAAAEAAAKRVAGPSAADRAADAAAAVRDAAAARAAAEAAANAAKARAAAQAKANEAEAQRAKAAAAAAADRARAAAEAAAKRVAGPSAADRAADAAAAVRAAANAAKARAANRAFGGFISNYAIGGMVNYKGSTERAPGMMYGGSAKKYAYGSIVPGRGMTDKVPALLTPGEFVVRKRVAEQYGPLLELLNGQVFPTMKTNSFNSSNKTEKSGSMYNYNVNVTLNGSDMDANDVANAVMQKIKMTENKGIRSNNIRG
jgi:TP901 family phage tail tape measure protein